MFVIKFNYLCKVSKAQNLKQNIMKAKMTITKIFNDKTFMFIYFAEIGQTWKLTESYEAGNGQTWTKSSWKKFVNYRSKNSMLDMTIKY